MSGATSTIQQPAGTGSIAAAVGLTALVAATAVAFAVAVGTAGRIAAPAAAPAPIYAPAVRDLGSRDLGTIQTPFTHDLGSRDAAGTGISGSAPVVGPRGPIGYHASDAQPASGGQPALGYNGFGVRIPANVSNGSNQAPTGLRGHGLRPS